MGDTLIHPALNNNVCASDFQGVLPCPSGEAISCTTECIDVRTPDESCDPGACEADSVCASDTTGSGRFTTSCVWEAESLEWKCKKFVPGESVSSDASGTALLNACNDFDFTKPCPADSYCTNTLNCGGWSFPEGNGMCRPYELHYELCDGDASGTSCYRCAHGTDCVSETGLNPAATGRCRKPCTTVEDCPCGDDGNLGDETCSDGYCYQCAHEGDPCDDGVRCCDDGTDCGERNVCCRVQGVSCNEREDCCQPNLTCVPPPTGGSPVCVPCATAGNPCTADIECCANLACDGGLCKEECNVGDPCPASSAKGHCKKGKTACDPLTGKQSCVPGEPNVETCNGIDDDCDGIKDNGIAQVGTSCSNADLMGACQPSFSTSGVWVCKGNGPLKCEAEPGTHFCNAPTQSVNGQFCGGLPGQSCSLAGGLAHHGDCPPNSLCSDSGLCTGWVDPPCSPNSMICWMPADNNLCNGVNVPNGWIAP